jgi:tetratricopeptide (TPR) repeat protein
MITQNSKLKTQNCKSKVIKISLLTFTLNFYLLTFTFLLDSYARTAVESLAQVEKLFMEGKYDRVVAEANRLIDAGAHGREELFYLKALSQIQLGAFKGSRETFRYMVERYPRGKRVFDGYLGIGDAFFLEDKIPESITSYNEAITNCPDHKNMPAAYYKLGVAYRKLGSENKARECLDKAKKSSPLSFESSMVPDVASSKADIAVTAQPKEIFWPQAADTGDYFYVQTGYFKNKGNAEKLAADLKQKGYDSYIATQRRANLAFHRVKVGRFSSKAEAEDMARKLKDDGYKTKVCR